MIAPLPPLLPDACCHPTVSRHRKGGRGAKEVKRKTHWFSCKPIVGDTVWGKENKEQEEGSRRN